MISFYDNYYLKGCLSGMSGIILSHPIDTIKTNYQNQNQNQNLKSCNKLKFNYSIKNLYKGISSPLLGVGIEKAIVFGTYNYFKSLDFNIPISGAFSGFAASVIVSPYERIKILKQTNQEVNFKMCLKPSFLFKGLSATFTREVPGFAIYFSTYETLKDKFFTSRNKEITIPYSFLFGGLSGSIAWIFIYPQDRIKTILQSSKTSNSNKNVSILKEIIKNTYKMGGLRHFYNGFSFAIMRAILLHSGTFATMEFLNKNTYC
jgi:solute carrier family 25 carnitine/acylcarnitine transporter 20/29